MDWKKYLNDISDLIDSYERDISKCDDLVALFKMTILTSEKENHPQFCNQLRQTEQKELFFFEQYRLEGSDKQIRIGYDDFLNAFRTDILMWGDL